LNFKLYETYRVPNWPKRNHAFERGNIVKTCSQIQIQSSVASSTMTWYMGYTRKPIPVKVTFCIALGIWSLV
jgi:transcription initiation factor TFIIIB Brf1 subunit/transcription initiation factor TFIIB